MVGVLNMRVFRKENFRCFYDQDSGRTFEDIEFRECYFQSSAISMTDNPELRSTVRNVRLIDCKQRGCALEAAVVEDVLVDGFKTNGLFQTWAAAFKHVTIKGKVDQIMISQAVASGLATPAEQHAFDEANAAYYATVDWALDVTEAEFDMCDIRGVPARLVRRNPETSIVITRQKALEGVWRALPLPADGWCETAIDLFLEREDPDLVLIGETRARDFHAVLDAFDMLRDAGVVEQD